VWNLLFLFSASLPASAMVSPRKKIEAERERLLRDRSASFEKIHARVKEREEKRTRERAIPFFPNQKRPQKRREKKHKRRTKLHTPLTTNP